MKPGPEPLLAPRVNTLSKALTRTAVRVAKRAYDLSQPEWQVITLLGVFQPISIRELARSAMLDGAQISRAVTNLRKRGYVVRETSELDAREAVLTLSETGSAMNKTLRAAALKRNAKLLAGFSERQVAGLFSMLETIIERARDV